MNFYKLSFSLCVVFLPVRLYAAEYISDTGFAAECPITGYSTEVAPKCSSWCKNKYGDTKYGTMVSSAKCSSLGIESNYEYCCANNAASSIVLGCVCADSNQITIKDKSGGKSYSMVANDDGTYDYTCENLYCFCNTAYYGARQLVSESTTGTCTKCPCIEDTYNTSSGAKLCGWTANNYMSLQDNANAPSYTINDCKVGPITGVISEQYRTYNSTEGTFVLSGACPY